MTRVLNQNVVLGGQQIANPPNMSLVLNEDFQAGSLNPARWSQESSNYGSPPRLQYYRPENLRLAPSSAGYVAGNQSLYMDIKRESFGGQAFTAGMISTRDVGVFYPALGRYECRLKVPHYQGAWPAFWLRHRDGSSIAEMDIFEYFHTEEPSRGRTTFHYTDNEGVFHASVSKHSVFFEDPAGPWGWHTWTVDMIPGPSAGQVQFYGYLDGVQHWSYLNLEASNWKDRYGQAGTWDIALQGTQVGGAYIGSPDDPIGYSSALGACVIGGTAPNGCTTTANGYHINYPMVFPAVQEIDYVRVWGYNL